MFSINFPEIMFPKYDRNDYNCERPEMKWEMKDTSIWANGKENFWLISKRVLLIAGPFFYWENTEEY